MHEIPREKLVEIVRLYGQIVTEDPRRVEALLRDYCPHDTREINLIVNAAREQVPVDLLAASEAQPLSVLTAQLSQRLCTELGITAQAARWAVESWALALGKMQPSQTSNAGAKSHLKAGNVFVDQEQFMQAAAEYQEAIRLDPEYAEAYNNFGISLAEQGEMADAVKAFRQAVRIDPEDAESQSNLGNALLQLGLTMEAVAPLQEALRLHPDDPDVQEALRRAQNPPAIAAAPSEPVLVTDEQEMPSTLTLPASPLVGASAASSQTASYGWLKTPKLWPLLLVCLAILAAFFTYHLKTAAPSLQPSSPSQIPPLTSRNVIDTSDTETKFPVHWGKYTVEREDVTNDSSQAQQEVRIVDQNDIALWKTQDLRVDTASILNIAGSNTQDMAIVTNGGGTSNGGTEFYFSRQGGLHLLFSRAIYDDSVDFKSLDSSSRPEMILNDEMSFLDVGHQGGTLILVYRWNGEGYINATQLLPDLTRKQAQDAQARYLKNWQTSPGTIYDNRTDALEYWANSMAIGEGAKAKDWLLDHTSPQLSAHLIDIEADVRKRVPPEGEKMNLTLGNGIILDKAAPAAAPTATITATATSPAASTGGTASDLGTPMSTLGSNSISTTRDTMTATAPPGSGLSDDPLSIDTLQNTDISADDLKDKSLRALSISHNTIYALHGYIFERPSVKSYFEAQTWYVPNSAFTEASLSPREQKNVQTIRTAEHLQFKYGPPVSLGATSGRDPLLETSASGSGVSDRVLSLATLQNTHVTDADLDGKSLSALSISYNAIYAAHGYVFERKSLQNLFGSVSWYHPNPAFAESDLTATEKANLLTIRAFERQKFGY